MRLPIEQRFSTDSDNTKALDWEALGRMVRERTLDALAMHFAAMNGDCSPDARMTTWAKTRGPVDEVNRNGR